MSWLLLDNAVGRVVAAVVSVDLAEEFWGMVPERQIVAVPTHGLVTVRTEASLVFELASVLSGPVRCAPGSVEKLLLLLLWKH